VALLPSEQSSRRLVLSVVPTAIPLATLGTQGTSPAHYVSPKSPTGVLRQPSDDRSPPRRWAQRPHASRHGRRGLRDMSPGPGLRAERRTQRIFPALGRICSAASRSSPAPRTWLRSRPPRAALLVGEAFPTQPSPGETLLQTGGRSEPAARGTGLRLAAGAGVDARHFRRFRCGAMILERPGQTPQPALCGGRGSDSRRRTRAHIARIGSAAERAPRSIGSKS